MSGSEKKYVIVSKSISLSSKNFLVGATEPQTEFQSIDRATDCPNSSRF